MPKRLSRAKAQEPDVNQIAHALVERIAGISEGIGGLLDDDERRRQIMREMGSRGGKIGGKRRLETMTATERKDRARSAAQARWKRQPKP